MSDSGSQMPPLRALLLVWLIPSFTVVCESATGATAACKNDCYRKTLKEKTFDMCLENRLDSRAGLLCCGKQPFNPAEATCCREGHGHNTAANVTKGLSQAVSDCCGLRAYNSLNEICCLSTVLAKPAAKAQCCGKETFDMDKEMCCGPIGSKMILQRKSIHHRCCGQSQFDTKTQCCCPMNESLVIHDRNNSMCCEEETVLLLHCGPAGNKKTQRRLSAHHQCCGRDQYNNKTECCCLMNDDEQLGKHPIHSDCCVKESVLLLHCGPAGNKKTQRRLSAHHQCCGRDQYNNKTECCCLMNESLGKHPIHSDCCVKESGVQHQKPGPLPSCTSLCGSSCYNPDEFRCCERNQTMSRWCCAQGPCDAVPSVYNPRTHVCCDGCVSAKRPWMDQCCGERPFGLAQRGVLCCNNTLYEDREDGEECSEFGVPYNPAEGTTCGSQFYGSPGQHCCGTEVYQPQAEICCDGHRSGKGITEVENLECCGIQAYNVKNPQMKCCAGTLYSLPQLSELEGQGQCCGSILQKPLEVCCSSEDKQVLYSAKTGLQCCGQLYYNTSLWSCCAGKLSPARQPGWPQSEMVGETCPFLSMNNLNESDLCEKMQIRTVESVSLHSIVFSSVWKIYGRNATVKYLSSPYEPYRPDRCNSPKLIPGKEYFFYEDTVVTDFNHDSILKSLHFIFTKCENLHLSSAHAFMVSVGQFT